MLIYLILVFETFLIIIWFADSRCHHKVCKIIYIVGSFSVFAIGALQKIYNRNAIYPPKTKYGYEQSVNKNLILNQPEPFNIYFKL